MRIRNLALALLLLGPVAALAQSVEERTRQALDQVLAGKCDRFYSLFNAEMKGVITLSTYEQQTRQMFTSLGKPGAIDPPRMQSAGGLTTVAITIHWPAMALDFIVAWDKDGKVAGTRMRSAEPPPSDGPSSYSHPDQFTSEEATIGDDQWKLPGTLLVPKGKGPFAAVVLVHGSGPGNRDEAVGGVRVFRDLAEGLASHGVAVLRYDKRTRAHPDLWSADPNLTMTDETVVDAVRALMLLRTQPRVDAGRVFVLGHSQGGYMAPRIMKADSKLAGAIVMAGNSRPLEEIILDQNEDFAQRRGALSETERAQLEALRRNPRLALGSFPAKYIDDLNDYRPVALAKSLSIPMLILQGERDFQVTMKDLALWKSCLEGRSDVTLRSYPKLNHLFVIGEGRSSLEEYQKPGHVAPEVIDDIANWIAKR